MKNVDKLVSNLRNRKPFKIIYDGEDFGTYIYNQEKNRYEGVIGHIDLEAMYRAIKDNNYFIQAYEIEKN